eukprot:SAG11_NODE_4148_length_2041_cov_1.527806_2_plen_208_part_00
MEPTEASPNHVYVGNISFDTTVEGVVEFIEMSDVYGVVNVDLKTRREDGRSKGWALVECVTPQAAASCVERLNGLELEGRALRVNLDRGQMPRKPPPRTDGGFGGGPRAPRSGGFGDGAIGGGDGVPGTSIYVGNLPWAVDNAALFQMCEPYSPVSANVAFGRDGRSRGFGIVQLATQADASSAISALNETERDGRSLVVRWDRRAN